MKKRGVESLISWILIIGFTIALGTFITIWAINLSNNLKPKEPAEVYCEDIQLMINTICLRDNKNIEIDLKNKGPFTIWNLTIDRETNERPIESCLLTKFDDNKPIKPQESKLININAIDPFIPPELEGETVSLLECPSLALSPSSNPGFTVNKISFIPWIITDKGDNVACSTKKLTIDDKTKLNNPCS